MLRTGTGTVGTARNSVVTSIIYRGAFLRASVPLEETP
jgi:hypothetical protein